METLRNRVLEARLVEGEAEARLERARRDRERVVLDYNHVVMREYGLRDGTLVRAKRYSFDTALTVGYVEGMSRTELDRVMISEIGKTGKRISSSVAFSVRIEDVEIVDNTRSVADAL
jgi:hypothetical protein